MLVEDVAWGICSATRNELSRED